jgi:prepilin-type N-terminal cleavage/methylation domain-containing protein
MRNQPRTVRMREPHAVPPAPEAAFTLIELLVVISIIGVLASLTVGLSGLATRKSKESRIQAEMTKLVSAIENYKSQIGSYPPDNTQADPTVPGSKGTPGRNQLFYELGGTTFNSSTMRFYIAGKQEQAPDPANFGAAGYANSARQEPDLKFTESFKANQFQLVQLKPAVQAYVLVVPVKGPSVRALAAVGGGTVNPWLYVSSSPTNNAERFDLWTEVVIGKNIVRFSNWENDPVVVGPAN